MPAFCSLLLEVFKSAVDYDLGDETVDWSVSTDPAHARPWLMPVGNYGEQEADPVSCAVSIGTLEVGVIDVPQTLGDQTTGWMTERAHGVFGRRCRLRRYVDDDIGWVTIADGPAGTPRMDPSYSAYKWTIRDTRDTERKLKAFTSGGTATIVPRGVMEGFGSHEDEDGNPAWLIEPQETGVEGEMLVQELGDGSGRYVGTVLFSDQFDTDVPFGELPILLNPDLIIDEEGEEALEGRSLDAATGVFPMADVLWRIAPEDPWNVARPSTPYAYTGMNLGQAQACVYDGEEVRALVSVLLFFQVGVPVDFPGSEDTVEIILRHRGSATENYPFYFEGTAGELLSALYTGALAIAPNLGGDVYDPTGMEDVVQGLASRVRFDQTALDAMTTPVLLRQVEPVDDGRDWAEASVYGPSGWIPAMDSDGRISPVSRNRPVELTGLPNFTNSNTEPSPDWNAGERVVTEVRYSYKRFFVPTPGSFPQIATEADGLAVRDITLAFTDPEAELVHAAQPQEFEASVFSAIGDADGSARTGIPETGSILAQEGRFEVLARYRNGAQSFGVAVPRSEIPTLRVGAWVTWNLSWLPHRTTGLRGGASDSEAAAQVLAIRDDDCAWRSLLLEESSVANQPGYYSDLDKTEDEPQAGYYSDLGISDDTEGGS